MPCEELLRLRAEWRSVKQRMDDQRRKARVNAGEVRSDRPSGTSEYLPVLARRLQRATESIERHVHLHHCQE